MANISCPSFYDQGLSVKGSDGIDAFSGERHGNAWGRISLEVFIVKVQKWMIWF